MSACISVLIGYTLNKAAWRYQNRSAFSPMGFGFLLCAICIFCFIKEEVMFGVENNGPRLLTKFGCSFLMIVMS